MTSWLPYIFGVLSALVLFFVCRWILALTRRVKARTAAFAKLEERVTAGDKRWETLSTEVRPLWATLQTKLGADLTDSADHFKEPRRLVAKLEALTITKSEREQLELFMAQRSMDESVPPRERLKAKIMPDIMELVLEEAEDTSALVDVKLVGTKETPTPDSK